MENLLITELSRGNLQVYLDDRQYPAHAWPNFFRVKNVDELTFETLIGTQGLTPAADTVSYDSEAPLKQRPVLEKMTGDIPPQRVKRRLKETDLQKYLNLKRLIRPDKQRILDLIFNDPDFVVESVNAAVEKLCMQALFQQKILLTADNNDAGARTEYPLTYPLPSANNRVVKSAAANRKWSDATNAKPIQDIRDLKNAAKTQNKTIKYVVMNDSRWEKFISTDDVKDFAKIYGGAPLLTGNVNIVPNQDIVNAGLRSQNLPQIAVVESTIAVENRQGVITEIDPTLDLEALAGEEDKNVVGIPDLMSSELSVGPNTEEMVDIKQAERGKKGFVLVSVWSQIDPVAVFTKGEANLIPELPNINAMFRLNTEANAASGLAS